MITSTITVTPNPNISLTELRERMNNGASVMRSAHVGNLSAYNMAIAQMGIPVLLVDHNITGVDRNYSPEVKRKTAEMEQIAQVGQLVCSAQTFLGGSLVVEHVDAMKAALPNADIVTNTEYIQTNRAVFDTVVDATLATMPSAFERVATVDGRATKSSRALALAATGQILQFNGPSKCSETAILPNVSDIVGNFAAEAIRSGSGTIYHLSGPDMINYIGGMTDDINVLYARVATQLNLPSLDVQLIPTASAKFATTIDRSAALASLLGEVAECDNQLRECASSRKVFFTTAASKEPSSRQNFVGNMKSIESGAESRVAAALSEIPDILAQPGDANQLSQYDVSAENGLYIAEENSSLTMAELQQLVKRLTKFRDRALP